MPVMSELTDVVIEDDRWTEMGLEVLAERAARQALSVAGIDVGTREICIMACDDARIAELNADFRRKDQATNVLSWPAYHLTPQTAGQIPDDGGDSFGDIAIAYETCVREALEQNIPPKDHVTHLIIHGCLHLLGYDHESDTDADIMESLEIKALAQLGVPNPY